MKIAKNKKTRTIILLIILVLLALIIACESYLLFAKSNQLWPFEGQATVEQTLEKTKAKKENTPAVNSNTNTQVNNNSYNNANYNPDETVTTDDSINENGIDTNKQSTETQQDMNVLYGPEE